LTSREYLPDLSRFFDTKISKKKHKMPIVRSPAYKFTAQAVIGQDIKTVSLDGLIADGKCETFFAPLIFFDTSPLFSLTNSM